DLAIGATLYTPMPGEMILDGWIDVIAAWNGTTPMGDLGAFIDPNTIGWFNAKFGQLVDMTTPSADITGNDGFVESISVRCATPSPNPIKVVVSRDGKSDGGD